MKKNKMIFKEEKKISLRRKGKLIKRMADIIKLRLQNVARKKEKLVNREKEK